MQFSIEALDAEDIEAWLALRLRLWPYETLEDLRSNANDLLSRVDRAVVFVAQAEGELAGFAEATLRADYVNGANTSPVTFLEGLYVIPERRRQGIARALCAAIEGWGARNGCTEFASDALLENDEGQAVHESLGFRETERVVYFLKPIARDAT